MNSTGMRCFSGLPFISFILVAHFQYTIGQGVVPFPSSIASSNDGELRPQNNRSNKVVIAKDLVNLLVSCSNLSSTSKKIVLLAPVLYDLYSVVCDTRKSEMCEKMEVCKLVENVVGYVMMSAGVYDYGNKDVECDNLVVCFEHLIRVWTTDRGGRNCNTSETLKIFFPLWLIESR